MYVFELRAYFYIQNYFNMNMYKTPIEKLTFLCNYVTTNIALGVYFSLRNGCGG